MVVTCLASAAVRGHPTPGRQDEGARGANLAAMSQNDLVSLAVITAAAVAAVLLAALLRRGRIPGVVLEIALGIVVGPQVLHLVV
ncbi:MAG: hypothetical protein FJ000_01065 [Actinobacteria bacterium]|nr:hypothetical protein [Actinomycetota bacterium]